MTQLPVSTSRLTLRLLRPNDAVHVSGLMTSAVSRWLTNFPVPFDLDQARERMFRLRKAQCDGKAFVLAIERRSDPAFLGWFGVYRGADPACGVLGYWLGEHFQNLGYMTEAAPVALDAAAAELRLKAVQAHVHPDNIASIAILRRLGLHVVGEDLIHASARQRDERCLRLFKRLHA